MIWKKWIKKKYFNFRKKYLIIFIFILLFLLLIFFIILRKPSCNDGTLEGECSSIKPYFCSEGKIIEKASVCGCPENLKEKEDSCFSKYQINPKNITLKYVLRGEENEIDFIVYGGLIDYISGLSKTISYNKDEEPSRGDFKLKKINDEEQRELLLPLLTKIQNIAKDKKDQARIAISLVQNIPYGESENNVTIRFNKMDYSRYAYEVLYDMKGACEGRSELLAFLLEEIGYGVVLFYYPVDNHEVVGIKCPIKYSVNKTGYCFIETTGPSIISNDQGYYIGWGKLSPNSEMILISDGDSFGRISYEYRDARSLIKLNEIIEKDGELNFFRHYKLESLKKKYGLEHI